MDDKLKLALEMEEKYGTDMDEIMTLSYDELTLMQYYDPTEAEIVRKIGYIIFQMDALYEELEEVSKLIPETRELIENTTRSDILTELHRDLVDYKARYDKLHAKINAYGLEKRKLYEELFQYLEYRDYEDSGRNLKTYEDTSILATFSPEERDLIVEISNNLGVIYQSARSYENYSGAGMPEDSFRRGKIVSEIMSASKDNENLYIDLFTLLESRGLHFDRAIEEDTPEIASLKEQIEKVKKDIEYDKRAIDEAKDHQSLYEFEQEKHEDELQLLMLENRLKELQNASGDSSRSGR